MRATVVSIQEVGAISSLSVRDFTGGGAPYVCDECGLAPSSVSVKGRVDPATTLLEPVLPVAWVASPTKYRCRNREMCSKRAEFRSRQA